MGEIFSGIPKIAYEGPKSKNPFGVVKKSAECKHPKVMNARQRQESQDFDKQLEASRRGWKYRCAAGCSKP